MQLSITDGVTERLSLFLEQLGKHLWDSRQRASFAMYVLGLLSALPNKSVEPIAALFAADPTETDAVYQRLLHFLGVAPWPDADVRHAATSFALAELQRRGPVQTLVIDDTYLPKEWTDSQTLRESAHIPYQGRLYTGLQHHLSSVICTYAFVVAERERQERNGNPGKGVMVRTAEIPQRHSPTSIATLRKRIANAVTPWFLAAFPARPRRQTTQTQTDVDRALTKGPGG